MHEVEHRVHCQLQSEISPFCKISHLSGERRLARAVEDANSHPRWKLIQVHRAPFPWRRPRLRLLPELVRDEA